VRRIETYLHLSEVSPVKPYGVEEVEHRVILNNATFTWPRDTSSSSSGVGSGIHSAFSIASAYSSPGYKFVLLDITLNFPTGELSLVCGKLGKY